MNVRVLGPLEIEAGGCLVRLGPQQRRVFLALLLQAGQVVSGTRLGELIWGEPVSEGGAATLRSHVMRLRRALQAAPGGGPGEIALVTGGGGYALRVCSDRVDSVRFEALLARGREALTAGDPRTAGEVLRSGLELWRGQALAEVADRSFALAEVARLEGLHRVARLARIEADLAMGRHGELVGELEGLVAAAPREETLRRHLALALYRCHRSEEAAWVCQQGLKLLADRGLDSPRLQDLQQEILRGAAELDWVPPPPVTAPPGSMSTGSMSTASMSTAGVALHTLPRDVNSFTGRQSELRQLMQVVTGRATTGSVVGIHAIEGMAGIGKTAFAVHAAHQLAPHFPDGQIFLRLHAHTPWQHPVDPTEALATLLLTRGITPQQVPPGVQARELLWRDKLSGKKVLLVLDDAAGPQQVDPLLPGTSESLVLITSRRRLSALDDTVSISLDTLTPAEATALFLRVAARPNLEPTDTVIAEVTRLCGYLPLAIRLVAGRLHNPTWTLADVTAELAAARNRLAAMDTGARSVAAAFDLSYQDLTKDQQQLFRRLGLQPGTDIDAYATAAVHDTTVASARRHLATLYNLHLIEEPVRGRYRLHDLLRDYARTLSECDPPAERDAALDRLLDYYLHTTTLAASHLALRTPTTPAVVHPPDSAPELATRDTAITWLDTERSNLQAAADYAARHTRAHHAIHLPTAMHQFLRMQGPWSQALALHHTAIDAARRTGDRLGEAHAHTNLGDVQYLTDDYPAATTSLEQALVLYRHLGHRLGEAHALNILGMVQRLTNDYPAATTSLKQALAIYRNLGNRHDEAEALNNLGTVQRLTGDYPACTATLEQALAIYRDLGNRIGEAEALNNLGELLSVSGAPADACAHHAQALSIAQALGTPLEEARAREGLGQYRLQQGQLSEGAAYLQQALTLYRHLGSPAVKRVETTLSRQGSHAPQK